MRCSFWNPVRNLSSSEDDDGNEVAKNRIKRSTFEKDCVEKYNIDMEFNENQNTHSNSSPCSSDHSEKSTGPATTSASEFSEPSSKAIKHDPRIPSIFQKLCSSEYDHVSCMKNDCRKRHLGPRMFNEFKKLPLEELYTAYLYTKKFTKLYTKTFRCFRSSFEKLKAKDKLIQIIDDVLHCDIYNKMPYIGRLISSLCRIGMKYSNVIDDIFISNNKSITVSDILLEVVCIYHKKVNSSWYVVRKLIKNRNDPIDHGLVEEMMKASCMAKNPGLAVNIVQDMIYSVDLTAICHETLMEFLSLLETLKVDEQAQILRKQMQLHGIFEEYSRNPDATEIKSNANEAAHSFGLNWDNNCRNISLHSFNQSNKYVTNINTALVVPNECNELSVKCPLYSEISNSPLNMKYGSWKRMRSTETHDEHVDDEVPTKRIKRSPEFTKLNESPIEEYDKEKNSRLHNKKKFSDSKLSFQHFGMSQKLRQNQKPANKIDNYAIDQDDLQNTIPSRRKALGMSKNSKKDSDDSSSSSNNCTWSVNLQIDTASPKPSTSGLSHRNKDRDSCDDDKKIPTIFVDLCHNEFFEPSCFVLETCENQHLGQNMVNEIQQLSFEELNTAYLYTKKFRVLYAKTLPYFISAFEKFKSKDSLMQIVNDIFQSEISDKTAYIEKLILYISEIGFPYTEIIEEIFLFNNKTVRASNILLEVVCYYHQQNLLSNWCAVQKLIKNRTEPVNFGLVEEIMIMCYEEQNLELAVNIVRDMILSFDIQIIAPDTLQNFLSVLEAHGVKEGQILLEQMQLHDVSLNSDNEGTSSKSFDSVLPEESLSSDLKHSHDSDSKDDVLSMETADIPLDSNINNPACARSPSFSDISSSDSEDVCNKDDFEDICSDDNNDFDDISSDENICDDDKSELSNHTENDSSLHEDENATLTNSTEISVPELKIGEQLEEFGLQNLKDVIEQGNYTKFFGILCKCKNKVNSEAFILQTLEYFEKLSPKVVYDLFYPVITLLVSPDTDLRTDSSLMKILNTLTVNILIFFENNREYKLSSHILLQCNGEYDALCNSNWFARSLRNSYSEIGKYILFCKILIKGNHLKEAWKILKSKLLYGVRCDFFDHKIRNYVLEDLIKRALQGDVLLAKDILVYIIDNDNITTDINLWKFFNQLILKMLDNKTYKPDLLSMVDIIIEDWYVNLYLSVMRNLLVGLVLEIPETLALQLYDRCCSQKCYPLIKGDEKILYFIANMVEVEIYMTIHVYMYKKAQNKFPLSDVRMMIQLPDPTYEQVSRNVYSCIKDLKIKITNALSLNGLPDCVNDSKSEQWIDVQSKQLQDLFDYYNGLVEKEIVE